MKDIAKAISISIQVGVPILIWGQPGVGKSSCISSISQKLGLTIKTVIASLREPSDFNGLPIILGEQVKFASPNWAKELVDAGKGVLFLDELTTAPPSVQAALLRVVLDRVVGDLELPKEVAIIAAANPPEMAAGGWDLTPPMANRFVHLDWEIDPQTWADGLVNGWNLDDLDTCQLPSDWEEEIKISSSLVSQFITKVPHLLFKYPKEESSAGKAWASPRSWFAATRLFAACRAANVGSKVTTMLLAGAIGEGPAISFSNWLAELDLPNPESLLTYGSFDFSIYRGRHDKAYVVLNSLMSAVKRNLTVDRYYTGVKLCCQAAQNGFIDIAFPVVRNLQKLCPPTAVAVIPEMNVFGDLCKANN